MTHSHIFFAAFLTALVCGCNQREQGITAISAPITHSLMVQDFALSDKNPTAQLGQYTVKLVSVADDGATQIRVAQTDKVLMARPGDYFESYEFGRIGLRLTSATNGVAKFFSQGCMTR